MQERWGAEEPVRGLEHAVRSNASIDCVDLVSGGTIAMMAEAVLRCRPVCSDSSILRKLNILFLTVYSYT